MSLFKQRILALTLLVFSGFSVAGETQPLASPILNADTDIATAGFFRLSWSLADAQQQMAEQEQMRFELQESGSADFTQAQTIYTGPDRATTFSGRSDGEYFFRLRQLQTDRPAIWSAVTQVQVQHHSLTRAWIFFGLGALVFLATLALILRGTGAPRA